MIEATTPSETNARYLRVYLSWLRLRLLQLAEPPNAATAIPQLPAVPTTARLRWMTVCGRFSSQRALGTTQPSPKVIEPIREDQVAQAAEEMKALESADPPPALVLLSRRFGLSRVEQHILFLCAAMELDTRIAGLCAKSQDDPSRPYPTFALALALFMEDAEWEALSSGRPLRYFQLLHINQPGALPLTSSALRADERIVNFIKGLNKLDDPLSSLLTRLPCEAQDLPHSQQELVATIAATLRTASPDLPVVQLLGSDASSKQMIAARAAGELGLTLYRLSSDMLPAQWAELETLARLWQRETMLLNLALYIDAQDADRGSALLDQFVARTRGLLFLDALEPRPNLGRNAIFLDVAKPTPEEQQAAWEAALGAPTANSPRILANQFNLSVADIQRIARTTAGVHGGRASGEHLWDACRKGSRPRLEGLAQRIEAKAGWDDLILPDSEKNLLAEILKQVKERMKVYQEWGFAARMNRGFGISALFAGDSGTGKTMAAEVIAKEIGLDFYRIDLAAICSKWIGETAKHLRQVFDASEAGGALLIFDEAEALFGKRSTEVKSGTDRYANMDTDYLLQRMEAYSGIAILATNMKSAIDLAFVRRLRFIVNFKYPEAQGRKKIWEKIFPEETPKKGLDYDWLARLPLAGGNIHNIALNAAFLAAAGGTDVTMRLVSDAAKTELRKMDRPVNEADFRWTEPAKAVAA